MEENHVQWLLEELTVLVQKNIISAKAARRITAYYRPAYTHTVAPMHATAVVPAETKRGRNGAAIIPALLSVLAALLIAAGIISLIAYNWNAIPRGTKAACAFALLLAVQAGGVAVALNTRLRSQTRWREGVAVLWAVLFGAVMAFISQICRLPGNTAAFLFLWALSSLLVAYGLRSAGAFATALVQSCAYVAVCRLSGGEASLFYLLFAALCPFALTLPFGRHAMLATAAVMMGFVLEKAVPGLWMVCSVSFAVLCLEYGLSRNDRPLSYAAAAGLCLLLQALSTRAVWSGIGWNCFSAGHSPVGTVLDCLLAALLTGAAVAWPFVSRARGRRVPWHHLAYPFCALTVAALYVRYAFMAQDAQAASYLAPFGTAFLFSLLFVAHGLCSQRPYACLPVFFLCIRLFFMAEKAPLLAIASFLPLLEAVLHYRAQKGLSCPKNASAALRIMTLAVLLVGIACLHSDGRFLYAVADRSLLPASVLLYGCFIACAAWLFARTRSAGKSLDIIIACAAVLFLCTLNIWRELPRNAMCTALYAVLLAAAASLSWQWRCDAERNGFSLWIFAGTMLLAFVWTGGFVFGFALPTAAAATFLLLFEAVGRYRSGQDGAEREGRTLCGIIRMAVALWLPLALTGTGLDVSAPRTAAGYVQLAACACHIAIATFLLVRSKRWRESLDLIICVALVLALTPLSLAHDSGLHALYNAAALLIAMGAALYGFTCWRRNGRMIYLPYLAGFLFIYLHHLLPAIPKELNRALLFVPCAAVYAYQREYDSKKRIPLGTTAGLLCIALITVKAFQNNRVTYPESLIYACTVPLRLALIAATLFCTYLTMLPAMRLAFRRQRCNYVPAGYALVLLLNLLPPLFFFSPAAYRASVRVADAFSAFIPQVSFACIFLMAGYYIATAYKENKLARANCAGIYAALALAVKFFSDDYSFVAKGVLFIALGLAMLLLNVLLLKGKTEGGTHHED